MEEAWEKNEGWTEFNKRLAKGGEVDARRGQASERGVEGIKESPWCGLVCKMCSEIGENLNRPIKANILHMFGSLHWEVLWQCAAIVSPWPCKEQRLLDKLDPRERALSRHGCTKLTSDFLPTWLRHIIDMLEFYDTMQALQYNPHFR